LLFPVKVVGAIVLWPWKALKASLAGGRRLLQSARAWVLFILLVIATLVAYYVLSDRYTPFTTDAYVQAYVVQVAPRVEGQVVHVYVQQDQAVHRGDVLFEIDPRPFQHQVDLLVAKRVEAVQQVAQLESELKAAKADDERLAAEKAYAEVVHDQEKEIFKQEATTDRKYVEAMQRYRAARAALERSQWQISKAKQALEARIGLAVARGDHAGEFRRAEQALAARIGAEHALVAEVEAQLARALLDLEWARVYAACDGLITDLQLREGAYAHAGQAVLTLIDSGRWLVVANFRENAMSRLREGQPAEVALRGAPGRLFDARVVSVGRGVSQGQGVPSGQLPDVRVPASWVPTAQRFQVRLALDDPESVPLRVGMTGSASVYTRPEGVLNDVTRFWHRVIAWLYHL
jgi:multidrug resistance efflux pump